MSTLGACVESHDAELDGGFCGTLLAGHRTLAVKAQRQVAAVWANVCAGAMGLTDRNGNAVALDPSTTVNVAGFQGTVDAWLTSASSTIVAVRGSNERHEREALRRLIRVAWSINHGIGIGTVCPRRDDGDDDSRSALVVGAELSSAIGFADPEPLASELLDETESPLSFGAIQPNPFRTTMTMAYAVSATSEVSIAVYDLNGRRVRELVSGTVTAGAYVTSWDGLDENGVLVRGGMYFVLGRIGGQRVQSRVTFVR